MKTVQEKILHDIENRVIKSKVLEPYIQKNFSNTGTVYVKFKNSFTDTKFIIKFNFQTTYCGLSLISKPRQEHWHYLEYVDDVKLKEFFITLNQFLIA